MFCKVLCAATFVAMGLAAPVASADPIVAGTWYTFGFDGSGTPLVRCPGCTLGINTPDGAPRTYAPDAPWTITTTHASQQLIVLDGFLSVDEFEMFDFGGSIGTTSASTAGGACDSNITCALNDLNYSRGVFSLAVGAHSFTGTQIEGGGGAGFLMVTPIPEPGTFALAGLALASVLSVARRRG